MATTRGRTFLLCTLTPASTPCNTSCHTSRSCHTIARGRTGPSIHLPAGTREVREAREAREATETTRSSSSKHKANNLNLNLKPNLSLTPRPTIINNNSLPYNRQLSHIRSPIHILTLTRTRILTPIRTTPPTTRCTRPTRRGSRAPVKARCGRLLRCTRTPRRPHKAHTRDLPGLIHISPVLEAGLLLCNLRCPQTSNFPPTTTTIRLSASTDTTTALHPIPAIPSLFRYPRSSQTRQTDRVHPKRASQTNNRIKPQTRTLRLPR